jgi:hypothetical protein
VGENPPFNGEYYPNFFPKNIDVPQPRGLLISSLMLERGSYD